MPCLEGGGHSRWEDKLQLNAEHHTCTLMRLQTQALAVVCAPGGATGCSGVQLTGRVLHWSASRLMMPS
jgi:hypothetical protein